MPVKKQLKKLVKGGFDFPTLMKHLNAEDPLALVLRGHLYVEASLIKRVESALVDKKALEVARFNFPKKVSLAMALGKVDPADARGFTALNELRNKFAHNVEKKLTEQDELNLYNVLSTSQRKITDVARKPGMTPLGRLRFDVMGLIANAYHPSSRFCAGIVFPKMEAWPPLPNSSGESRLSL
jgi:hypothetical protein